MSGDLIHQGDHTGELRGGLAGPACDVPTGFLTGEALVHVHPAVARTAHRDVRYTALVADHGFHPVLVGGPGEYDRGAATARQRVGPGVALDELVGGNVVRVVPHAVW
jgi:hypothetical protein